MKAPQQHESATDKAISQATKDYLQKLKDAQDAQAEAERLKAGAVSALVERGKDLIEELANYGEKYSFAKVPLVPRKPRKPRGPNKPKTAPLDPDPIV